MAVLEYLKKANMRGVRKWSGQGSKTHKHNEGMPGPIYSLGAGGVSVVWGFGSEGCNGERGTKQEERRNSSDLEAEMVQFLLISWDIWGRLDPEVQLLGVARPEVLLCSNHQGREKRLSTLGRKRESSRKKEERKGALAITKSWPFLHSVSEKKII